MKICLFSSFLIHIILLFVFQQAFPFQWAEWKPKRFEVELIRPPMEKIKDEELTGSGAARLKEDEPPPPEEIEEATISLDTKDKRYVSYASIIKQRILKNWQYPQKAKDYLIEGKLLLIFSLSPHGRMMRNDILESSGYKILDREALRAVQSAAPFPPFPDEVKVKKLNVKVNFDYRLATRKAQGAGAKTQGTERRAQGE